MQMNMGLRRGYERRRNASHSTEALGRVANAQGKALIIEKIYVPAKRRKTLERPRVEETAESMLESGQRTPILVREDGPRFVLIEGLHRLEACRALGETTIMTFLVQAWLHTIPLADEQSAGRRRPGSHSARVRADRMPTRD